MVEKFELLIEIIKYSAQFEFIHDWKHTSLVIENKGKFDLLKEIIKANNMFNIKHSVPYEALHHWKYTSIAVENNLKYASIVRDNHFGDGVLYRSLDCFANGTEQIIQYKFREGSINRIGFKNMTDLLKQYPDHIKIDIGYWENQICSIKPIDNRISFTSFNHWWNLDNDTFCSEAHSVIKSYQKMCCPDIGSQVNDILNDKYDLKKP